jgi:IclR family acetate operon transcriptional repressor
MFHGVKHINLPSEGGTSPYAIRVLDRALDTLEVLRDAGHPLTLQEFSTLLPQAKSSIFRLLSNLERRGYVQRTRDRKYQLGAAWLRFRASGGYGALTEVAAPQMRQLLQAFGETVNLGVLRDGEVFYLEILQSPHSFRMAAAPGTRSPVHSTALGKAIAAFLPPSEVDAIIRAKGLAAFTSRTITTRAALVRELARIRSRGYAEDNGETEPEASCVGASIHHASGEAIGAISLSGPISHMRPIKHAAGQAILAACQVISIALSTTTPRPTPKGR